MTAIRSILVCISLVFAAPAAGETIRVPDDQLTIQAAVDEAEAGDVIRIGEGDFAGFSIVGLDVLEVVGESGHRIVGDVNVSGSVGTRLLKLRVEGDIRVGTSQFTTIRKCRVFGGDIEVSEADTDIVARNRVENPQIGVTIEGDGFNVERNLIVAPDIAGFAVTGKGKLRGNKVEGGFSGIVATGRVKLIRNQIVDVAEIGIEISGEKHLVKGNEVLGSGDDGIVCTSGSANRFKDNLLKRTNDGFDIKADCSNNELTGNRIKNANSDGIDLVSNGNLAEGNLVKGTAAVGIELNGTGNTVVGNTIRGAGEQALREDVGGNTLSGNSCPGDPVGCN